MELRPYQEEAVQALRDNKKGIIAAATGSGKTTMMAASIKEKAVHGKILVLVHLQDLVTQTTKRLKSETGLKIAQYYGQSKDDYTDDDVVVATWQSLHSLTDNNSIPSDYFYSINVDEAHHIRGEKYQAVVNHFSPTYLHGFTATPYGPGQAIIFELFGDVIFSIDIFNLIEMGFLSKMHMSIYSTNASSLNKEKMVEYNQRKAEIINEMVEMLRSESRIPKIVHFFKGNKHIKAFQQSVIIPNSKTYTSNMTYMEKKATLQTFKEESKSVSHIYSLRMLNEGVDIPIINGLIFHENSGNFRTLTQRIGRGIRVFNNHKDITYMCQFLDESNPEDIETISSFKNEIEQALQSRKKTNKDYSDFIVLEFEKGTKDFLNEYRKRLDTMAESDKIISKCGVCHKEFPILITQLEKLQNKDTFVCNTCNGKLGVLSKCKICQDPIILSLKKYYDYVNRNINFYCQKHGKKKNGAILHLCDNCGESFTITASRHKRILEKKQLVSFCSMSCRTEYSKITVKCFDCKKDFRIRRGDYNAAMQRNQHLYCEEHKRNRKTA